MASSTFAAIASGGAIAGATDKVLVVRSGATDLLCTPVALDVAQTFAQPQTFTLGILTGTANPAAAAGTNIAGAAFTIAGGMGTGNAEPGVVGIKYGLKVASGTTAQAQSANVYPIPGVVFVATADLTLTASTATTGTLIGTGVGTTTVEAGLLRAGRAIRIRAFGLIATSAAGPTFQIDIKLGATVIATTGAKAPPSNVAGTAVFLDVLLTCRTTGATGTVQGDGSLILDSSLTAVNMESFNKAVTTVDLTAAQAIDVFGTWSANTAGNNIKITSLTIEYLN